MISLSVQAGLWGLLAGGALILGALISYFFNLSQRTIAVVMAFGSGVLISALCFELMDEAYKQGGISSTTIGFISGALIFTIANKILEGRGASRRKHSGELQISEKELKGSGIAIAIGSLLDGIPESIVIGLSLIADREIGLAVIISIFISNIPEGLSSAAGMKRSGRSAFYIFSLWVGIAVILGFSAFLGYVVFSQLSPQIISVTIALAAGAILAMIADTMIPEAYEKTLDYTGLITVIGFIISFILSKTF